MPLPPECMQKGHPSYGGGRPRTSIPQKEELIELGKDLIEWASKQAKKGEPIRVRFCDWYTDRGFIRKQWENFRDLPEFEWYYEKARSLMSIRYIDGTVNSSIAHRYLRMYDPELRDQEDADATAEAKRKEGEQKTVNISIESIDFSKAREILAKAKGNDSQNNPSV